MGSFWQVHLWSARDAAGAGGAWREGRVLGQAVLPTPFANASGFAFGCLLPARICGDRVGHRRPGGERLGESGDLEDAQDARSADYQCERSAGLAEPFDAADEGSQAGRVDKVHSAQVGDEVHGPLRRKLLDLFAQRRRGIDVDLAGHLEDGAVADRPDGLQVELSHVRSDQPSVIIEIDKESYAVTLGLSAIRCQSQSDIVIASTDTMRPGCGLKKP